MDCNKSDCIHYKVCEEWKSLGNDNYINESNGNCDLYSAIPYNPSEDCISREYVEGIVEELENICQNAPEEVLDLLSNVRNAPSVDPERPQAEWVNDSDNLPICKKCGEIALQRMFVKMPHLIQDVRMVRSNFCPNCGAKMSTEAEDAVPQSKKEVKAIETEHSCVTCKFGNLYSDSEPCCNCTDDNDMFEPIESEAENEQED